METGEPGDGAEGPAPYPQEGAVSDEAARAVANRLYKHVWDRAFMTVHLFCREYEASELAHTVATSLLHKWRAGRVSDTAYRAIDVWAMRAARLEFVFKRRGQERRGLHEAEFNLDEVDAHAQSLSLDEMYYAHELLEVLRRAIAALPRRLREVFVGMVQDQKDDVTLARELHLTPVTVRRHYQIACERLQLIAHRYVNEGLVPEDA